MVTEDELRARFVREMLDWEVRESEAKQRHSRILTLLEEERTQMVKGLLRCGVSLNEAPGLKGLDGLTEEYAMQFQHELRQLQEERDVIELEFRRQLSMIEEENE